MKELNSTGLMDSSIKIKKKCQQLKGKVESSKKLGTKESRRLWSNIWVTGKSHNKNAEWLKELRSKRN